MREEERVVLFIASRLLSYPEESIATERAFIGSLVDESIHSAAMKEALLNTLNHLSSMPLQDLQETYVATFDLKEKAGLYLTAHELGDSRKRGAALIKLQKMIHKAGFERVGNELTDYIPMLYELISVSNMDEGTARLKARLSFATQRIKDHVQKSNPFSPLFHLLMTYVFEEPSQSEIEQMENEREEADLEPLPYPILYQ